MVRLLASTTRTDNSLEEFRFKPEDLSTDFAAGTALLREYGVAGRIGW